VAFCGYFKGCFVVGGGEGDDVTAPAELVSIISVKSILIQAAEASYTNDTPMFDALILLLNLLQKTRDLLRRLAWCTRSLEEMVQLLFLLLGVRGVPRDICRLALKPIWHKDLILVLLAGCSQYVGTLEGLWEVAEDVIDVK